MSWTQQIDDRGRPRSEAVYQCNGMVTGSGFGGFMAVLKRLASLHDSATVRIDPVRIRTHGPFANAVIIKGQRHFETTGKEPFRGMIDLLGEITRQKRLRVEVIPDEGEANRHPGALSGNWLGQRVARLPFSPSAFLHVAPVHSQPRLQFFEHSRILVARRVDMFGFGDEAHLIVAGHSLLLENLLEGPQRNSESRCSGRPAAGKRISDQIRGDHRGFYLIPVLHHDAVRLAAFQQSRLTSASVRISAPRLRALAAMASDTAPMPPLTKPQRPRFRPTPPMQ